MNFINEVFTRLTNAVPPFLACIWERG